MSEYLATPRASSSPFEPIVVALAAATTKTVLQVGVPSSLDIKLLGWGVSFDGASGTAVPVICHLVTGDVAATVTSLTPEEWGNEDGPVSSCVGGTAATGYNASVEGTMTAGVAMLDAQHVHPQSGYGVWWLPERRPRVKPSRFLRIRCKAPATINVIPWVIWDEPAV